MFEFEHSRAKVAIFRKTLASLYCLIYGSILFLYHTNALYDMILDKSEFKGSRAKVTVTVAIF